MTAELVYLTLSVILAFAQILLPAAYATRERGTQWNAGPRDAPVAPLTGVGGRLERAQRNMLETFPLFVAAIVVTLATGTHNWVSITGSALYFWARLAYVPLYALGIPYVRSLVWVLAMAGLFLVLLSPLAGRLA